MESASLLVLLPAQVHIVQVYKSLREEEVFGYQFVVRLGVV